MYDLYKISAIWSNVDILLNLRSVFKNNLDRQDILALIENGYPQNQSNHVRKLNYNF